MSEPKCLNCNDTKRVRVGSPYQDGETVSCPVCSPTRDMLLTKLSLLSEQLAAEKEARVKAEKERDGWKEAYDGEIEGNRTVSLTIGGQKENEPFRSFLKRVGDERKTAEARVKELEAEVERLRKRQVPQTLK